MSHPLALNWHSLLVLARISTIHNSFAKTVENRGKRKELIVLHQRHREAPTTSSGSALQGKRCTYSWPINGATSDTHSLGIITANHVASSSCSRDLTWRNPASASSAPQRYAAMIAPTISSPVIINFIVLRSMNSSIIKRPKIADQFNTVEIFLVTSLTCSMP